MHKANRLYLQYLKGIYPQYFSGDITVLEFGSWNINGSAREYITPVKEWIGIDWRAGPDVDLVSLAHEVNLGREFDVVISASLLEHDPYWDKSLESMVKHLKKDGILILSWCSALSIPHCIETAPDGKYHGLKAGLVLEKLKSLGVYVHEFHYECNLYPPDNCRYKDGRGEIELIAFKDPSIAIGPNITDSLLLEDQV